MLGWVGGGRTETLALAACVMVLGCGDGEHAGAAVLTVAGSSGESPSCHDVLGASGGDGADVRAASGWGGADDCAAAGAAGTKSDGGQKEQQPGRACAGTERTAPTAEAPAANGCDPGQLGANCTDDVTGFTCKLRDLWGTCADHASIGKVLSTPISSDVDLVLALFPEARERPWYLSSPEVTASQVEVSIPDFDPYELTLPLDWTADPYANNSWRLWFQSLYWLEELDGSSATAPPEMASVLVDWTSRILMAEPRYEWTWSDHALAQRVQTVVKLVDRRLARTEPLELPLFAAASRLLVTHLYALAADPCYTPEGNHGVMQDMAVFTLVTRFRHLPDSDALWDHAAWRFLWEQLKPGVAPDGVHREHSPGYHQLFTSWLPRVVNLYQKAERTVPSELTDILPRMLVVFRHLLQPNGTFPQFGDTTNEDRLAATTRLIGSVRDLPEEFVQACETELDELEYVVSAGQRGTEPRDRDAIFAEGGYAAFRTGWTDPADEAVVSHLRSAKHSTVHYHPDETSYEVYGFGTELVVDSGHHSYDRGDPYRLYQKSPFAHNLLTVDEEPFDSEGASGIDGGSVGDAFSWVHAFHEHYANIGVPRIGRTFAFKKPYQFLVVDEVQAQETHRLVEHIHLHPLLDQVDSSDGVVVATSSEADRPSLVIVPLGPEMRIDLVRGQSGDEVQGWWFPAALNAEAATDVMLSTDLEPDTPLELGYLLVVGRPGEEVDVPRDVVFQRRDSDYLVSWQNDAGSQELSVPAPE